MENQTKCACSKCDYVDNHTEQEVKEMAKILKKEREQYPPFPPQE